VLCFIVWVFYSILYVENFELFCILYVIVFYLNFCICMLHFTVLHYILFAFVVFCCIMFVYVCIL